jgi:glycosyltransferase involved in cell wall biosynthesis
VALAVGLNLLGLGPRAGGIGRYVQELVPALLEAQADLRLAAVVARDAPEELTGAPWARHVRWVRLPAGVRDPRVNLAAQLGALPALALALGLDVLHNPANVGPVRLRRAASVVTLHDLIWLHMGLAWEDAAALRSARRWMLRTARGAERVLADSEAARQDLVANAGLDADRVDVALLGTTPSRAQPTPARELRARLGLGEQRLVLCVAQKRPYKNQASLVRALAALPGVRLVLPGAPTPYEDELRALARELGVAERVHLPDWVSEADLEGLYAAASIVALPSRLEGFGLPVLEAMARGVPVACAHRGALAEVAGDDALTFDPDDQDAVTAALRRLLGDEALAAGLARRGRARAAAFTWRRTAEATLACYRRALFARRERR